MRERVALNIMHLVGKEFRNPKQGVDLRSLSRSLLHSVDNTCINCPRLRSQWHHYGQREREGLADARNDANFLRGYFESRAY